MHLQQVATKSNKDLLLEIFGDSSVSAAPSSARPPLTAQKSTVDDILGLFGSTSIVPASAPASSAPPSSYLSTPTETSTFSQSQPQQRSQSPPRSAIPPTATQPRLPTYTAYEKNDLKITLTPQSSPTKPGVVMILARFQVSGAIEATGLNFQAAVPKVGDTILFLLYRAQFVSIVHIYSLSNCKCCQCRIRTSDLALWRRNKCGLWHLSG